jgi:hypothetical protein
MPRLAASTVKSHHWIPVIARCSQIAARFPAPRYTG